MTKTTHTILFFLLATAMSATAQIKVRSAIDTTNITIGDHVHLTITAENPGQSFLLFPAPGEIAQNGIEVISQQLDTTMDANGKIQQICQRSIITAFNEGTDTINPLAVRYQPQGDSATTLWTDPMYLAVSTVAVDTNQAIKDIEDIMKVPLTFREVLPWLLMALGIAAIAIGLWLLRKHLKKRKKTVPTMTKPNEPADKIALEQLEQLRIEGLWKQGRTKEYHTNLTDILRQYLYNQYDIDAAEMTSDQITEACENISDINEEQTGNLNLILQTADLVKFAKAEPQPWEHDRSMGLSVDFVAKTATATKQRLQQIQMQQKQQNQTE